MTNIKLINGDNLEIYSGEEYMEVRGDKIIGVLTQSNEGVVIPLSSVLYLTDGLIHEVQIDD